MPEFRGDWTQDDAPDWMPQRSAIGLADGIEQFSSVGQLWHVSGGQWIRVPRSAYPDNVHKNEHNGI